jgi:hypothetical protein
MSNTSLSPKGIAALLSQVKPTMDALKAENIGSPVSLEGLDDRAAALRAYLGPTDYSKQLQQAQDAAKLQAALSLASRGFASMGATPKKGESPFATIGRELLAPVGADLIPVSTDLMKRKAAIDAAKQTEDRQVKLAALTQAQAEKKSQESLALSLIETMTKSLGTTNLSSTIKDNQQFSATVGDKVLTAVGPVLVVKSKDGKQQQIRTLGDSKTLSGKVIPAGTLVESVGKAPEKATVRPEPVFGQVYKDGKFVDVTNVTVTSKVGADNITPINTYFIQTGTPGNVEMENITGNFFQNIGVHGKWTSGDDLYVADSEKVGNAGIQGVRDGDKIQMFVRSALPDRGGIDEVQYRFKGKDVTGKISSLLNTNAVQTRDLDDSQKQDAGQRAPTYKTQQKLVLDKKTVQLFAKTLYGAEIGEEVTVEANTNDPSDVRYMFRGTPLDASIGSKIAARPLSKIQKIEAGQEPEKFTPGPDLVVNVAVRDKLKGLGLTAKIGDKITTTTGDVSGLQFRFKDTPITGAVARLADASELSPIDRQKLGLDLKEIQRVTNTGPDSIKVGQVTIPPNGSASVPKIDLDALAGSDPGSRSKLRVFNSSVDLQEKEFVAKKSINIAGNQLNKGQSVSLTQEQFSKLPDNQKDALAQSSTEQESIRRKVGVESVWKSVQDLNEAVLTQSGKTRSPTETELNALSREFEGKRGSQLELRKRILEMLQRRGPPGEVDSANRATDGVERQAETFAEKNQARLNRTVPRYDALVDNGKLPNRDYDQLRYIPKVAFANLTETGIPARDVNEKWQAAIKKIEDRRDKFKFPDASDSAAFTATARLKILTDYLLVSGDIDQSGKLVGPFAKFGVNVLADYGEPFTSSESKRFNQVITEMRAALKTLSASEGDDTRPSNYRIALQEDLLPLFTKPEVLNINNLKTVSAKLSGNIRSQFVPEFTIKNVVPQSWVKAANQAGVKVSLDPKTYADFLDPNSPQNRGDFLVSREEVLRSIGKEPFSLEEFNSLSVGQPLPLDANLNSYIKVSGPTNFNGNRVAGLVQMALPGTRKPDPNKSKYPFQ